MPQTTDELDIRRFWEEAGHRCGAPDGEFSKPPSYLDYYAREFAHLRDQPSTIIEVGVFRGQFLECLARFLPQAKIIGLDFQPERVRVDHPSITLLRADQADTAGLQDILRSQTPDQFDVLIDDASHVGSLTKNLYDAAIPWLKSGGAYYIEDWTTAYSPEWQDGSEWTPGRFVQSENSSSAFPIGYASFSGGMAGVIKAFVDEVGAPLVDAHGKYRPHPIKEMSLWIGVVKLVKA